MARATYDELQQLLGDLQESQAENMEIIQDLYFDLDEYEIQYNLTAYRDASDSNSKGDGYKFTKEATNNKGDNNKPILHDNNERKDKEIDDEQTEEDANKTESDEQIEEMDDEEKTAKDEHKGNNGNNGKNVVNINELLDRVRNASLIINESDDGGCDSADVRSAESSAQNEWEKQYITLFNEKQKEGEEEYDPADDADEEESDDVSDLVNESDINSDEEIGDDEEEEYYES